MAYLTRNLNLAHGAHNRTQDVKAIVFLLNQIRLKNQYYVLFRPPMQLERKHIEEIRRLQRFCEGVYRSEPFGTIKKDGNTMKMLHRFARETTSVDKRWEDDMRNGENMTRHFIEQSQIAAALEFQQIKDAAEARRQEKLLRQLYLEGAIPTLLDACAKVGVAVQTALAMVLRLSNMLIGNIKSKIDWWLVFFKNAGVAKLTALLNTPLNWSVFMDSIKNLKGLAAGAAIITVIANATYYFSRKLYKDGITEIAVIFYGLAAWPAALLDAIECVLEAFCPSWKNSYAWRWLKVFNPARHARVVVRCVISTVHIVFAAMYAGDGVVNAAANDLLKWFESDAALKQLRESDFGNFVQWLSEVLIKSLGVAIKPFLYLLNELQDALATRGNVVMA